MSELKQAVADLMKARSTLEKVIAKSYSIERQPSDVVLMLCEQWRLLQVSLVKAGIFLGSCTKAMEAKEIGLRDREEMLRNKENELESKFEKVLLSEMGLNSRLKQFESIQEDFKKWFAIIESQKKSIVERERKLKERFEELDAREKELNTRVEGLRVEKRREENLGSCGIKRENDDEVEKAESSISHTSVENKAFEEKRKRRKVVTLDELYR